MIGDGFIEAGTTISVGGRTLIDMFAENDLNVFDDNRALQLGLDIAVEGPIRVETAGGSDEISGPMFSTTETIEFTGFDSAVAFRGVPADDQLASANTGQSITLMGSGFIDSTQVQFTSEDESGAMGIITVSGFTFFGDDGSALRVTVPALAKTGNVTVVGTSAQFMLQIVPELRGVGGTITEDAELVLEGAGLVGSEVSVTIDGEDATGLNVAYVGDVGLDQMLLDLIAPSSGVSNGVITVTTTGGSFTLLPSLQLDSVDNSIVVTTGDVGDTIVTALPVALPGSNNFSLRIDPIIGDNAGMGADVDVFQFSLDANDTLFFGVDVERIGSDGGTDGGSDGGSDGSSDGGSDGGDDLNSLLRIFDENGQELAFDDDSGFSDDSGLEFTAPSTGNFFVAVSGFNNFDYDPNAADSGDGGFTGEYFLTVDVGEPFGSGTNATSITSIDTGMFSGTPARARVAAANTEQLITLNGSGFRVSDGVVFETISSFGTRGTATIVPETVAADGSSLTVHVPEDATTGIVRIDRDVTGVVLQIVPTLTRFEDDFGGFPGGELEIGGTGFAEGAMSVTIGDTTIVDRSTSFRDLDVSQFEFDSFDDNVVRFNAPDEAQIGPVSVTTFGGTSAPFGPSISQIVGTADSGTAADPNLPSANTGQTLTIEGTGFTESTQVFFSFTGFSSNGVFPQSVSMDGTSIQVVVPTNAATGNVSLIGSDPFMLQIVPTVSSFQLNSSTQVTVIGTGLIEDDTRYQFGTAIAFDTGNGIFVSNSSTATVIRSVGGRGDVIVRTAGGSSAPIPWPIISTEFFRLEGVAFNPANDETITTDGSQVLRFDDSGDFVGSFAMPSGFSSRVGLQITPSTFTLGGNEVPSGSLLIIDGDESPDRVFAVNPVDGTAIATLEFGFENAISGVFNPNTGTLFMLDPSPDQIFEVNPSTGDTISQFATPFNISSEGGLTLEPMTGKLWFGSDNSTEVFEITTTGSLVRSVDLSAQGISNDITGLAFDDSGRLLASSNRGILIQLDVNQQGLRAAIPSRSAASITPLDTERVAATFDIALQLFVAAGARLDENQQITIEVTDLDGPLLGLAPPDSSQIFIDSTAAGYGWHVDSNPEGDRAAGPVPNAGFDLLTVILHEIGHVLGERHSESSDELMHETLELGIRKLPTAIDSLFTDADSLAEAMDMAD